MESSHDGEDQTTPCRLLDASTGRPIDSSDYAVTQTRRIGPIEHFIRALAENVSLSIHYGQRLVDATTSTTSNASRTPAAVLSQPSSPESLSRGFTYTKDRDQIRQYLLDCTIRARAVLEEVGSVLMALDRLNDEWAHIQQGVPSEDRDVMSESMAFASAANRVLAYKENEHHEFLELTASILVAMLADRLDTSNVMTGILSVMGTAYRIAMTEILSQSPLYLETFKILLSPSASENDPANEKRVAECIKLLQKHENELNSRISPQKSAREMLAGSGPSGTVHSSHVGRKSQKRGRRR